MVGEAEVVARRVERVEEGKVLFYFCIQVFQYFVFYTLLIMTSTL